MVEMRPIGQDSEVHANPRESQQAALVRSLLLTQFESGQGEPAYSRPSKPVRADDPVRPPDPRTRAAPPSGGVSNVFPAVHLLPCLVVPV